MDGTVRRRLRCFGWVQGVGFRYRARHAASAVGATGWVRNDVGGTVSMEIQGTQAQIDREPWRVKVVHNSVDYTTESSIGTNITIKGDSPVFDEISDATAIKPPTMAKIAYWI